MGMNTKKNYLYHITIFFVMFLYAAFLTMSVFLGSEYNFNEFLDKTTAIKEWTISENNISNKDDNNEVYLNHAFLNQCRPHTKTITKNICSIPMIAAIPKEFSLLIFRSIFSLFSFLSQDILFSNKWTLVNQKIRLDI